jgi:hypothetical protein
METKKNEMQRREGAKILRGWPEQLKNHPVLSHELMFFIHCRTLKDFSNMGLGSFSELRIVLNSIMIASIGIQEYGMLQSFNKKR